MLTNGKEVLGRKQDAGTVPRCKRAPEEGRGRAEKRSPHYLSARNGKRITCPECLPHTFQLTRRRDTRFEIDEIDDEFQAQIRCTITVRSRAIIILHSEVYVRGFVVTSKYPAEESLSSGHSSNLPHLELYSHYSPGFFLQDIFSFSASK